MSPTPKRSFRSASHALSQMRFLCVALALLVLAFAAVAAFAGRLAHFGEDHGSRESMRFPLLLVAFTLSAAGIAGAVLLPPILRRTAGDGEARSVRRRLGNEMSVLVVGAAMLEAPGLFWCVLSLLYQSWLYALGGVLAALFILVRWPTAGRLEEALGSSWNELERRLAEEDREAPLAT